MEAEQAGAVLRLLDLSFAVDVIREWAPKTAADALAHVPHALAADLLACNTPSPAQPRAEVTPAAAVMSTREVLRHHITVNQC